MFNSQATLADTPNRTLLFHQSLAAAFKARRQHAPLLPASMQTLTTSLGDGPHAALGRPGLRTALMELRASLYQVRGRELESSAIWRASLATAVFAARLAQLHPNASVAVASCGALLHRAGEALALKILARVELDHRLRLDTAAQRQWCTSHGYELKERLVRAWALAPEFSACILGWERFGEFAAVSAESAAVYFGRLFAIELLHPEWCVPGALEESLAPLALPAGAVEAVRAEAPCAREWMRAFE